MAEKVIHEIRFIETEDGFRIEVKGDKQRMREMGFRPRSKRRFRPRGRRGRGPGFGPDRGFGPWWRYSDWWRTKNRSRKKKNSTRGC
jgi:hypothetical protein